MEHISLALFFVAQATVQFLLSKSISIGITQSHPTGIPWQSTYVLNTNLFALNPAYLTSSFLLLTGLAHLGYYFLSLNESKPKYVYTNLEDGVDKPSYGIPFFRWIEYSITSTIMIVVISLISGITDITSIIGVVFCNASMIYTGILIDRLVDRKDYQNAWAAFWIGTFAGIGPWVSIFVTLSLSPIVPAFVYAITLSIFFFFFSFGILEAVIIYASTNPNNTFCCCTSTGIIKKKEFMFLLLSFSSKSLLSWLVFGAFLSS